jgi:hypothetical protein
MKPAGHRSLIDAIAEILNQTDSEVTQKALEHTGFRAALDAASKTGEEIHKYMTTAQEGLEFAEQEQEKLTADTWLKLQEFVAALYQTATEQADHELAAAKTAGAKIIDEAQSTAIQTLRDARERAAEAVAAAERMAAQKLVDAEHQTTRMVETASEKITELERAAKERVMLLISKIEQFTPEQDEAFQSLESLAQKYASMVDTMSRLRTETRTEVFPAVQKFLETLKANDFRNQPAASPPSKGVVPTPVMPIPVPSKVGSEPWLPPAPAPEMGNSTPRRPRSGRISLQQASETQAKQFVEALARMPGVSSARVTDYYAVLSIALISVVTTGESLDALTLQPIDGLSYKVENATKDLLTVEIL